MREGLAYRCKALIPLLEKRIKELEAMPRTWYRDQFLRDLKLGLELNKRLKAYAESRNVKKLLGG